MSSLPLSLYLHLPFCERRCPYCDFAISLEKDFARYTEAITREISRKGQGQLVATIHLGGGTPSRMPPELLEGILREVRGAFAVAPDSEIALEMNPEDRGRASAWAAMGVNRLSIGAQSFDDAELRHLGRGHSAGDVDAAVGEARAAGLRNLSLDLMYGLPGQVLEGWRSTLDRALALTPEHLSVYALTLTGAKRLPGPPLPSEGVQADMALEAIGRLEDAGFRHYEISNFARPGFESRHNLAYWTSRPYLGLGASAHSYLPPRRFANVSETQTYVVRMMAGGDPTGFSETLTPEQEALERLFLGLRLPEGVDVSTVREGIVPDLEAEGLLILEGGRARLTPRGRVLADAVTGRLVLGVGE